MKYDNFTPQETEILNKLRELRELMVKYYPDNKHTSCCIIERDDEPYDDAYTYITIMSDWKGKDTELDVTVWDKRGE